MVSPIKPLALPAVNNPKPLSAAKNTSKTTNTSSRTPSVRKTGLSWEAYGQKKEYFGTYPSIFIAFAETPEHQSQVSQMTMVRVAKAMPIMMDGFDTLVPLAGRVNWFWPTPEFGHQKFFMPYLGAAMHGDKKSLVLEAWKEQCPDCTFPLHLEWSEQFGEFDSNKYPIKEYIPPQSKQWKNIFITEKCTFAIKTTSNDLMMAAVHAVFGGVYGINAKDLNRWHKDDEKTGQSKLCNYLYDFWKWLIWKPGYGAPEAEPEDTESATIPVNKNATTNIGGTVAAGALAVTPTVSQLKPSFFDSGYNQIINHDRTYFDFNFSLNTPFDYRSLSKNFGGIQTMYVKESPEYNFYIKCYEEVHRHIADSGLNFVYTGTENTITKTNQLQKKGVAELLSPNMYMFLSEQDYLDDTEDFSNFSLGGGSGTPYSKYLTLNGNIKGVMRDVMSSKATKNVAGPIRQIAHGDGHYSDPNEQTIKVGEKDIGDYFLKWTNVIRKASTTPIITMDLITEQKNICFLNYDSQIFQDAEDKKHFFPMNIGIEFSTTKVAGFADLLRKTNFMYSMMNHVHNRTTGNATNIKFIENLKTIFMDLAASVPNATNDFPEKDKWPDRNIATADRVLMSWDIMEWWNTLLDGGANLITFGQEMAITPLGSRSDLFVPGMTNKFYKNLLLYKFKKYLKDFVNNNRRSFMEVVNGKEAHSEILFYRIEKLNSKTKDVIQNIYIPNSSYSDVIKYYDTQVVYNKKYTYNIFAYALVVGSKYDYEWNSTMFVGDVKAKLKAEQAAKDAAAVFAAEQAAAGIIPDESGLVHEFRFILGVAETDASTQKVIDSYKIKLEDCLANVDITMHPTTKANMVKECEAEYDKLMADAKKWAGATGDYGAYSQWLKVAKDPKVPHVIEGILQGTAGPQKAIITKWFFGEKGDPDIKIMQDDLQAVAAAAGVYNKVYADKAGGFKIQYQKYDPSPPIEAFTNLDLPSGFKPTLPYTQDSEWKGDCGPNFYGRATATIVPEIRIIEVPYHTIYDVQVVDSPPIHPEASIVPYRGRDDKIKINLRSNTGRFFGKPIWLNSREYFALQEIKDVQARLYPQEVSEGKITKDSIIMFESDDPVRKYEIYKLREHPTEYEEFGRPLQILEDIDSWIDYNIAPNRKYYYMFRAIDQHGHFSNPSPIYELEMINNSGAIYSIIKIVDFIKPSYKTKTKPFRKYLQIIPTFEQKQIVDIDKLVMNPDITSACDCEPQLGNVFTVETDAHNAPARKFKIRLISRSTGKKLDINVRFTHYHNKIASDLLCIERPQNKQKAICDDGFIDIAIPADEKVAPPSDK